MLDLVKPFQAILPEIQVPARKVSRGEIGEDFCGGGYKGSVVGITWVVLWALQG